MRRKQLGIFAREPRPGEVKTRLVPPLSAESACELYEAFLADLFRRLGKLSNVGMTVFHAGGEPERLRGLVPKRAAMREQIGDDLGLRLRSAFEALLGEGGAAANRGPAVVIGSDSPDLPIQYIKRAFVKLKHKDVVLGPAADGGYYLIGMRAPDARVFEGVRWSESTTFADTLVAIERAGLSLATLPPWYDVDAAASLDMLRSMVRSRRIEQRDRLRAIEAVLGKIDERDG